MDEQMDTWIQDNMKKLTDKLHSLEINNFLKSYICHECIKPTWMLVYAYLGISK